MTRHGAVLSMRALVCVSRAPGCRADEQEHAITHEIYTSADETRDRHGRIVQNHGIMLSMRPCVCV